MAQCWTSEERIHPHANLDWLVARRAETDIKTLDRASSTPQRVPRGTPHMESANREREDAGTKGCGPCELRKSEDATHLATDGPAPRRYDRCTAHTVRCAAVFDGSEYSNALVGGGVPPISLRLANLDTQRLRWHAALCA